MFSDIVRFGNIAYQPAVCYRNISRPKAYR